MTLLAKIRYAMRVLFRRGKADRELEDEVRFHLQKQIEANVADGMNPEEARHAALRIFGGIDQAKEGCRDARGLMFIDTLFQDLRFALRGMRKNPGFTAVVILTLALGIGANTAVFSVVNTVLLKPLPYPDPDRIVTILGTSTGGASDPLSRQIAVLDFREWQDQSSSFEAIAYYRSDERAVMSGGMAEYIQSTIVSPDFFSVFAVEPILGRFITADEVPQAGGGVLLSHGYWQSHLAGGRNAIGQTIRVNGRARPILGVLPPEFNFPNNTDLWIPVTVTSRESPGYRARNYLAVGRIKANITPEQAQAELITVAGRLEQQYPDENKGRSVAVARMRDEMVGDVRLTLYLLFGAVGVVLLITCANVATLLLSRATARSREVAVRVALGAGHRRIARQLITEGFLLAFFAGASGLLLAYWGSKALIVLAPANLPRLTETDIDAWVLAFTLAISIITSLLFGLMPAFYASKVDLNRALKEGGTRSVTAGGVIRLRGALVIAEVALAVVLLSAAGLLIKSFVALQNVAVGFQPENVLVMRATGPPSPDAANPFFAANQFFKDVLSKVANLPGVLAAGATMAPPGNAGATSSSGSYFVDHMPAQPDFTSAPTGILSVVAPGTFAALGIPLKRGRDFNDGDSADAPWVVVVNEALVRHSLPGKDPIGRTIFCGFDMDKGRTIVGVVGDVRQYGPASEPVPECFMPYLQHRYNMSTLSVVVRTTGNPNYLAGTVRRLVNERSPEVPITFTTMEARLSETVAAPRFRSLLFGIFGVLAICLAMAGVYGVIAHAVGQQSKEIGLRMALGATSSSVFRRVLGQGLVLVSIGLAVGLAVAIATTRLVASMLFQVQPNDPSVYVSVAVLLGVVTLLASYIPARRAARVNPMMALRSE